MIGGMGGIFANASYGQSIRDLSRNTDSTSAGAQLAGGIVEAAVTIKTGNPIVGRIAGRFTEGVVSDMTSSNGGADLSNASLPKP